MVVASGARAVEGLALVDTGATLSMIRPDVALVVGAPSAPEVRVHGLQPDERSTAAPRFVRAVRVTLRIPGSQVEAAVDAVCVPFGEAVRREDIVAILGRDVLGKVQLDWDGPKGSFSIRVAASG